MCQNKFKPSYLYLFLFCLPQFLTAQATDLYWQIDSSNTDLCIWTTTFTASDDFKGALYTSNNHYSELQIEGIDTLMNGYAILPQQRSFRDDYRVLPLELTSRQTYRFKLSLQGEFDAQKVALISQTKVDELIADQYGDYFKSTLFSASTLFILLFLCFFSFGRYWQSKETIFLYYAAYLFANFGLLLRTVEFSPRINIAFSYLPLALIYGKTFFSYLAPMIYIFFQERFLDIPTHFPAMQKRIRWFFYFLLVTLILHYIGLTIAPTLGQIFHYIGLIGMLLIGGFLMTQVFLRIRTALAAYVLVGTFLLIVGGVASIWEDMNAADPNAAYWGGSRVFLQIGILIEMLCFSLGLGYKSQQQQKAKLAAQQNLLVEMQKNHRLEARLQKAISEQSQIQKQYDEWRLFSQNEQTDIAAQHELIKQINELLTQYLNEVNFGVSELAEELAISRGHLSRQMKKLTSYTPTDYIRRFRLQEAMRLLKTTNKNISEIAYEVGFRDPSHFTKSFSKNFGTSPSDIRKMQQN
ncbi:MAG: helix-turn-helix domain-containing protein [Bacteroidota bacterium]